MPDILNKIVECDHLAQEIVLSAKQQQKQQIDEMQENIREMRKTELAKAYAEIAAMSDVSKKSFRKASEQMDDEYAAKCAALDEKYSANKDEWLKEMFDRIVDVQGNEN